MTKKVNKVPLDFSQYEKYEIPQEYLTYKLSFYDIDESQCEDLEFEYTSQGYKLFHSELERSNMGMFNLTLIIGKCNIVF